MGILGMIYDFISWCIRTIWSFFKEYVDVCDAILTTIAIYNLATTTFGWGKGWSIALGIIVALIAFVLFNHRIGFWIVSVLYSGVWSFFATMASALLLYSLGSLFSFSVENWMLWVSAAIAFIVVMSLHVYAKERLQAISDEIDEEKAKKDVQEFWYDPRAEEMRPISTKPLEAYDPDWWGYKESKLEAFRNQT